MFSSYLLCCLCCWGRIPWSPWHCCLSVVWKADIWGLAVVIVELSIGFHHGLYQPPTNALWSVCAADHYPLIVIHTYSPLNKPSWELSCKLSSLLMGSRLVRMTKCYHFNKHFGNTKWWTSGNYILKIYKMDNGLFRKLTLPVFEHLLSFTFISVSLMGSEDKLSPLVRCIEPQWQHTCVVSISPVSLLQYLSAGTAETNNIGKLPQMWHQWNDDGADQSTIIGCCYLWLDGYWLH